MDPEVTFRTMLTAYRNHDTEAAREHAQALLEWLESGGFPPRSHTRDTARAIAHAIANGTLPHRKPQEQPQ